MNFNSNYEIKKEHSSDDTREVISFFLDKLISLYIRGEHDKISKILMGTNESKEYKYVSRKGTRYIDNDTVVSVRVWTDNETREYLETLYCICKDKNMMVTVNNKMIGLWLYEMNTEMSRFFYRSKNIECSRDSRLTIEIEKEKWDAFTDRIKLFKIKSPEGFKDCVNKFLKQKATLSI